MVSAERGSESFSFQLKQNITYRDCRHDSRAAAPETLQITMERVFVMYVKDERILRYAITNKISPVGGESERNWMEISWLWHKPNVANQEEMRLTVELIKNNI